MENTKKITGDMLVGQICAEHPEAVPALQAVGMHCLGCPASRGETIEEACQVHGVNADELVEELNKVLNK